jgi:hypothetical protein
MAATVFFSWQADTPTGTGRNFLRKALEDACEAIASDAAVNEAHRELTVDSDTQGVAGQEVAADREIVGQLGDAGAAQIDISIGIQFNDESSFGHSNL